jgi:predicted  nucleic acid-binding Zn-ribbon protein
VKKNDEYRALTTQIAQMEQEISELEEAEIGIMLEIDEAKEVFQAERATIEERIENQRREIVLLDEREQNYLASLAEAKSAFEAASAQVDAHFFAHYERVKKLTKRAPYVVQIEDHRCGGCHLRVSNEVSKEAFKEGELHFCDQCARIVYA